MRYVWETNSEPKLLELTVNSAKPQKVIISLEDAAIAESFYHYQKALVKGSDVYEISLPITPQKLFFEIKPESEVALPWGANHVEAGISFSVKELPFERKWDCRMVDSNPLLQEFLSFAVWFSKNKNILAAEHDSEETIYRSESGNFNIRYLPEIIDTSAYYFVNGQQYPNPNYRKTIPTSFRIHTGTKEIQCAKKYLSNYTFPMCMALFTHEFSHVWLNKDPDDEFEADYNSIMICRCLGFSKREIADAYAQVFERFYNMIPNSEQMTQNVERMNRIITILKTIK